MTYAQQIKHPMWQKKRLEVLEANKYQCENCGGDDMQLHVHHPLYKRGAMIWEYTVDELQCLCEKCHKDAHAIDEKLRKALSVCPDKGRVLGYINTLNSHFDDDPIPVDAYETAEGIADYVSGHRGEYVGTEPLVEFLVKRSQRDKKDKVRLSELLEWTRQGVQL